MHLGWQDLTVLHVAEWAEVAPVMLKAALRALHMLPAQCEWPAALHWRFFCCCTLRSESAFNTTKLSDALPLL